IQLVFLHFRKYQILLLFWCLLFAVIGGSFMKGFGANALFLAPEYLGDVNFISMALIGIAIGVFIMCWNITTFILFSRYFTFLAATRYPFLKYCINNSIIPFFFLLFFVVKAYQFTHFKELIPNVEIIFLGAGLLVGLLFILSISFLYFFRADQSILKNLQPLFNNAKNLIAQLQPKQATAPTTNSMVHSEWFLDSYKKVRRCRDVSHYSTELMDTIFKRHHFAAVVCVLIAYLFLIVTGFFLDYKVFQIPAAASITIFMAILIGVSGALAYFLQSWSVPVFIIFILLLNTLYKHSVIDPTNKAYGLNYSIDTHRPTYSYESLAAIGSPDNIEEDKKNMIQILNNWKARQPEAKPVMVVMCTSGGGTRSATFTMNILQALDSITGGNIMKQTVLITGASGGMIGATYFRELYRQRQLGKSLHLQDTKYVTDISKDLLNPTFSSFVSRDIFAPEQKFSVGPYTYLRDRGYAFEAALNENTNGVLNKRLKDYVAEEHAATIPMIVYHSVIVRDGKKMLISGQPLRFMMAPPLDTAVTTTNTADAVDFLSFFAAQNPLNLRILTALRMNATFPVVLPNVWLPTIPVIDVMDGGLRDNYGLENSFRFIASMKDWIKENTSGVLMVQIRDRLPGGWEDPFDEEGVVGNALKPFLIMQNNWFKIMEYEQNDMLTYFSSNAGFPMHKVVFQYATKKEENKAALNFHLTQREKRDISASLNSQKNMESFRKVSRLVNKAIRER
ncbi:MAG: patatin-like phospholipase family protein, partial [Chitinophagaceae bacterium]